MRRAIVAGTATVSGVVLLLGLKPHSGTVAAQGAAQFSIGSASAPASSAPAAASSAPATAGGQPSAGAASPSAAPKAPASSGTKVITGVAADTRYGPVQLQVTFSGKKITSIRVLQYPTESYRDQQINSYALPLLNQEAMSAQSANIDVVSGATYTSDGYAQSLQSAIDKSGV
ncbi:FMN-binding protein [Actinocrinis puniceicyclus]|uniref:FMN-binding protein n=1 Tax=Actinocrinis puniceicyclus TaxID=977794 RepID=A0A8J7WNM5_9ACTN|nr:FMN-binding protein [Actinocrinis puniceicyclus]MBS2965743.1 FMN-binding protein [Actinocrinis puniceicyclus]